MTFINKVFNASVLDFFEKKKGFFSYAFWDSFEKFKGGLTIKDTFYKILTISALLIKIMNMFLTFGKLLR